MLILITLYVLSYVAVISNILLTGIFTIYRYFVGLYLSSKHRRPIEFVKGVDSLFCIDDETCRYFVGGFQIFKGRADIDKIRRRIDERWLQPRVNGDWKYGRLRQWLKRELGYFFWVPQQEFSVENHVTLYEGPLPKNKDEFNTFCAETLTSLPINKGIYWQFIFVNLPFGLMTDSNEPHFVLFVRFYHAVFDGISFNRLYTLLFDSEKPEVSRKKVSKDGLLDKVMFWGNGLVFGAYEFFLDWLKNEENHSLVGANLTGVKLISVSYPISLEKIKNIKSKAKTTVNDVMIASVVGAFRAYFLWKKEEIPRNMRFKIPVSFHNFQNEAKFENNVTAGSIVVPVDEPKCLQRLLKTKTAMDKLKVAPDLPFSYLVLRCCFNRVPAFITEPFSAMVSSTALVSCLPMTTPKKFLGNESTTQSVGLVSPNAKTGCGMAVGISSEGNNVTFTMNADLGVIKSQEDLDKLIEFVTKEVDELAKEFEMTNGINGQ